MQLFSGLDYLKIDIANSFGFDKKQFEERIQWFDETIEPKLNKDSTIEDILKLTLKADEQPLAFGGLQAYVDYLNHRPSGYRISLDACCSGIQILSALTACESGLEATGLISNKRNDAYTMIYEEFKRLYTKPNKKTRQDCKDAIMPMYYGSNKKPKEYFGHSDEELNAFYKANQIICNGAMQLRDIWCNAWNPNITENVIISADGFTAHLPILIQKKYLAQIDGYDIPFKIKELGTKEKSVSNCANATHNTDAMICRELVRRCMFDVGHYQYLLFLLNTHTKSVNQKDKPLAQKKLDKLGMLGELIELYEWSKFFTIRIANYINNIQDLLCLSYEHRMKLKSVLELMIKQGTFEISTIHDCFTCLPNNGNYIRYWYKELIADLVESNVLSMITEQISPKHIEFAIPQSLKKSVADKVRLSDYGIC